MSFLTPIRATTLRLSRPAYAYTSAAALHTSIPRPGLKESDHSESSPDQNFSDTFSNIVKSLQTVKTLAASTKPRNTTN